MTNEEFKSLKYGDVLKNNNYSLTVQSLIDNILFVIKDGYTIFISLYELNEYNYELVKPEIIDWDKPQLVYCGDKIVLTTGKHDGTFFEGVDINGEYYYSWSWTKTAFKPYKKTLTF